MLDPLLKAKELPALNNLGISAWLQATLQVNSTGYNLEVLTLSKYEASMWNTFEIETDIYENIWFKCFGDMLF